MTTLPLSLRQTRAPVLWLLGTALGWSLVPLLLQDRVMRTYLEVARVLPLYLLLGLVVGALTGLGQMQAWAGAAARRWLGTTVLAYGLALPAGLLIGILVPTLTLSLSWGTWGFLPWAAPGSVTYAPFPFSTIFTGLVVGLCQWPALKLWLAPARPVMAWLWVFGVWAGLGLGLFVGGWLVTALLGSAAQTSLYLALWGTAWGALAGLVSAAILWILQRESRPLIR